MAISTFGATLKYGAQTASNTLAIKDFPEILGARSALETTTLSDDAQTYIPGIRQQAEAFDFTMNFDGATFGQLNNLTAVQKCELEFSDGCKFMWEGYISARINEGSVDSVMEMTVSITPTTVPTFTNSATNG